MACLRSWWVGSSLTLALMGWALGGCPDGGGEAKLPVGSPCTLDAECAGPGMPNCLTDGLYPLSGLASSQDPSAQGLAGIGVPLPGGYCSTVTPCATNADCGEGGSCFFPLREVEPGYFATLVAALGLQPADAAVLEGFLTYGQCLDACRTEVDCTRTGYVCTTPIDDFLALVEGADRSTYCIGVLPACDPACAHGTCDTQAAPPACDCESGWKGAACDQNIDDCDPNPCQNSGTCQDGVNEFTCTCQAGWQGTLCAEDVPDCAQNPCAFGTCAEGAAGSGEFACVCDPGWEGELCDQNIDECAANPCQNGGTCQDGLNEFTCTCQAGWTGPTCEIAVQGCVDSPCVHGTCQDTGPGSYLCTCDDGWSGANCDTNIDDCVPDPCQNNGTCSDQVGAFTCDCATAPGWEGPLCDANHDDCSPNPCQNGGTCQDQVNGYHCDCLPGTSGTNCEDVATTECVLTYTLVRGNGNNGNGYTGSNLRIRDTTMGMGDGTYAAGPGTLILRLPSDGGQNPAAGLAEVLYYHLPIEFSQTIITTVITTDVDAASPELGQDGNTLEMALGALALGATPTISWSTCTYPAGYNGTINSFTPDVVGTGEGCVFPYRSVGNVNCDGGLCGAGGLVEGDNPQDETWEQALNTLTFSADLSTFSMPLMLVPDRNAARTYISWGGALVSAICQ